jgi:hypothetical protein
MKKLLAMLLATGGYMLQPVHADIINDAATGLTNPASTITFTETGIYAPDTQITTQYSPLGVTFNPYVYYDPTGTGTGLVANFNSTASDILPSFTMDFSSVLNAAAFEMINDPGITVTALLGNTTVDSFVATSDLAGGWFGFTNEQFNAIRFDLPSSSGLEMTNLEMNPVPEPSPAGMMLAIAGVIAAFRLRRRSVQANVN